MARSVARPFPVVISEARATMLPSRSAADGMVLSGWPRRHGITNAATGAAGGSIRQ